LLPYLRRCLPGRAGWLHGLFLALQLLFFLRAAAMHGVDAPPWRGAGLAQIAWSLVALLIWVQWLHTLLSRWRRVRVGLFAALLPAYALLLGNHLTTRNALDWAIVAANGDELLHWGSLEVVGRSIGYGEIALATALAVALVVGQRRAGWLSARPQTPPLVPKAAVASLAVGLLLAVPTSWSYDQITLLINSARSYYAADSPFRVVVAADTYPLVHQTVAPTTAPADRPDLVLVMLESFNQGYIEAAAPVGGSYTPCFNALIPRGLYCERFYSNSIQTCRGLFASLMSTLPSLAGKETIVRPGVRFQSIAALLRQHGYRTEYLQAYARLGFDNTGDFLRANGFDTVTTVAAELTPAEQAMDVGWGVPDRVLYRHFLARLDADTAGASGGPRPPRLVVLAPVANHQDWSHVPAAQRHFYPAPADQAERYANSLYLADQDLGWLVAQLEARDFWRHGALVRVGDHGYPMGGHGIWHTQSGFYDESFRVPLLILAPGRVPPERLQEPAASQLDLAPTLADLAGIGPYRNHFAGVSLLARPRVPRPLFLLQPYSGVFLIVCRPPLKYIQRQRPRQEFLFDLAADPQEQHNLAIGGHAAAVLAGFHRDLQAFYWYETLYNQNQVWPP
jgi:arylsulfatase A-like enzyme